MTFEEKKAAVVRAFAQLSIAEQEHILALLAGRSAELDAQQEEDARIDTTFRSIMGDVDL